MKKALIVGSAPSVYDELLEAPRWPLIVVNYAGIRHIGKIEMWVSMHLRQLIDMISKRAEAGGNMDFIAYSVLPRGLDHTYTDCGVRINQVPYAMNRRFADGSSGYLAVSAALHEGYERLILCGMPLRGEETVQAGGIIERRTVDHFASFHEPWLRSKDAFAPHVRSMSGWTRELLGEPQEEWIDAV